MSYGTLHSNKVFLRRYFDDEARRYDAIYERHKPFHQKVIDFLFRRVISKRFSFIMENFLDLDGKSVLDVGCGSGRFSLELARRGAQVVGIDMSGQMLALASERSRRSRLTKCFFIQGDFIEMNFKRDFDIILCIGVFDYLSDPLPFLTKILHLTQSQAAISFPRRLSLRAISRKARLMVRGCPVRFYSVKEVEGLFRNINTPGKLDLVPLSRDFIAFYKRT